MSLEKYDGKPRSDLNTWIAQVEEKCSLQYIPDDEVGRWAKVHLEGNALAFISRLGISDWTDIKERLQHQFIPRHNNQLLRAQLFKLRQHGDIQLYIHEFQAILNRLVTSFFILLVVCRTSVEGTSNSINKVVDSNGFKRLS